MSFPSSFLLHYLIYGIIFLGFGIQLSVRGIRLILLGRRLGRVGVRAAGKVIEISASKSRHGPRYPLVEFEAQGNRKITFLANLGGSSRRHPVGTGVLVRYDQERPEIAVIDEPNRVWLNAIAAMAAPAFLLLAGVYFIASSFLL
ncbi:MAG: DUF3592 domain-containing protein [bacterium]